MCELFTTMFSNHSCNYSFGEMRIEFLFTNFISIQLGCYNPLLSLDGRKDLVFETTSLKRFLRKKKFSRLFFYLWLLIITNRKNYIFILINIK
jgi:hypothetical protein